MATGLDPSAPMGPGLLERELAKVEAARVQNQLTQETQANQLKLNAQNQQQRIANAATDIVPSPGGQTGS